MSDLNILSGSDQGTNASVALSSSIYIQEILRLSSDLTWKNTTKANNMENPAYTIDVDVFMAANKGILTYDTIFQFSAEDLIPLGFDEKQLEHGMEDKTTIPVDMRELATKNQIERLLEKDPNTGHYVYYEEYNNYYRMLMGLPDIGDTDYVYNTKYEDVSYHIPIQDLTITERYKLDERGYLDEMLAKYPDKKYLKYAGRRMIDFYKARSADRFSILYMTKSEYTSLENDFIDTYAKCVNLLVRTYYSDAYRKSNDQFDGFIAMCILFMTIQQMNCKYLSADVNRDFYDLESIKYIYDSYGVPFYSEIPLEYHRKIVQNINRLLSYKGSTRVFFELFDIFDYGSMDVYEYYLIKAHRMDELGNPIFVYKEDGTEDTRAMYQIKFGKVKLYNDPPLELSDTSNHLDYSDMTENDPYWISDIELLDHIYEEKFNYLETKYVGIQTMFNLMKIMYEACYFFKMCFDRRKDLVPTTIFFNPLNKYIDFFDLIIYTAALICRKYGYAGNISTELPVVGKVLGYNFKEDLLVLKNYVHNDPTLSKDPELDNYIKQMNVDSLFSVNAAIANIMDFKSYLNNRMVDAKTREEWFAYKELQHIIMYSEVLESTYRKEDGTIATSFADLLEDISPELAARFVNEELDINTEIDSVLMLIKKSITSLKYIESADGIDISILIEYLFKILDFFKSAKSDLTGYNIVYTMSGRGINVIKLLEEIERYSECQSFEDKIKYLSDIIWHYNELSHPKDPFPLTDKIASQHYLYPVEDSIKYLDDQIHIIHEIIIDIISSLNLQDVITEITATFLFKDQLKLLDRNYQVYNDWANPHDYYNVKDQIKWLKDLIVDIVTSEDTMESPMPLIDQIDHIVEVLEKPMGYLRQNRIYFTDDHWIHYVNTLMRSNIHVLTDKIDRNDLEIKKDAIKYLIDKIIHIDQLQTEPWENWLLLYDEIRTYLQQNVQDKLHLWEDIHYYEYERLRDSIIEITDRLIQTVLVQTNIEDGIAFLDDVTFTIYYATQFKGQIRIHDKLYQMARSVWPFAARVTFRDMMSEKLAVKKTLLESFLLMQERCYETERSPYYIESMYVIVDQIAPALATFYTNDAFNMIDRICYGEVFPKIPYESLALYDSIKSPTENKVIKDLLGTKGVGLKDSLVCVKWQVIP